LISTDVTHVSLVNPVGTMIVVHSITLDGGRAGTLNDGPRTTTSGWIDQPSFGHTTGGGASLGSPSGAPASTHVAIVSISAWLSDRSVE
jgi:hypothetical protein